jgi:hypothetical protein
MVRVYLERLAAALAGDPIAREDHRWMTLELFDQMVRNKPGGEMQDFLLRADLPNREFILSRVGREAGQIWDSRNTRKDRNHLAGFSLRKLSRLLTRLRQEAIAAFLVLLSGPSGRNAYREGLFRNSGEVHRLLYDRLSLAMVFSLAGFVDVRTCAAGESRIPGFSAYRLDVSDGLVRKPDSLFMEGSKPR